LAVDGERLATSTGIYRQWTFLAVFIKARKLNFGKIAENISSKLVKFIFSVLREETFVC
jgi:hypothetical protein